MPVVAVRFTSRPSTLAFLNVLGSRGTGDSQSFSTVTASVLQYDFYGSKPSVKPSRVPG
jgi:hypothetical protein